jgi:hypothetical protein
MALDDSTRLDPLISDHKWMLMRVVRADSLKDLDGVEIDLENDIFENQEYARDKVKVSQIRYRLEQKRKELLSDTESAV